MMSIYCIYSIIALCFWFTIGVTIDILSYHSVVIDKIYRKYSIGHDRPPIFVLGCSIGIITGFCLPLTIIIAIIYYFIIKPLARFIDNFPYRIVIKETNGDYND